MTADHDAENGPPDDLPAMGGMDLGGLLESAQNAMAAQAETASRTVEGSAGGGVVRLTMTGTGEVSRVVLDPDVVDPEEVEMLEDLIVAALADASTKVAALQREALGAYGQMNLGDLTGGVSGGLDGLLGGPGQPER
jgi:hypothetical protein